MVWPGTSARGVRVDTRADARQRILDVAYELFTRRGVRAVGVDEVINRSGVAKATLYRHFPSKDDLVLAVLELRHQRWTVGLVLAEATSRGATPQERLLAVFDVFDEWFRREDFEACSFINTLLELRPEHRLGEASRDYLADIRATLASMADEADLAEPEQFARSMQILMMGSIVAAMSGDTDAAKRAQTIVRSLIDQHLRHG
jgi:AcrR family transcriptional regulator